jgi:hypothetical protein
MILGVAWVNCRYNDKGVKGKMTIICDIFFGAAGGIVAFCLKCDKN